MISYELFTLAYLLDLLIGDPECLPHPVRLMGWWIARGERSLRQLGSSPKREFIAGALLVIVVVGGSSVAGALLVKIANEWNLWFGRLVIVYLASTTIATRNLIDEARQVNRYLRAGEIERARAQVSRIVGRDTKGLAKSEIVRAAVETVAESASDGIVAPMFYLALGGVPAALAYKAVNTLDSVIGHNDERYQYFGKFAARLDDVANYIPARLTALLIALAALIMGKNGRAALYIWWRDAALHASPNAGQLEAAMAGALEVQLGGLNYYDGEPHYSAAMGDPIRELDEGTLDSSIRLVTIASLLMYCLALGFLAYR